MTCPRTAAHEETELLIVLRIPFRVRTPIGQRVGRKSRILAGERKGAKIGHDDSGYLLKCALIGF
jgi:hypothetical protein